MNQILTQGIILSRTDFGEADRILTVITPDNGKLRLMAKGVRKERSKLAGGIELFSISQLSFIPGKREIGTLTSSRLSSHFAGITKDIKRTMLGYELLKRLNRVTEDAAEGEYFRLLAASLEALAAPDLDLALTELWFNAQLLKLAGHSPNLKTDNMGKPLKSDAGYGFDPEAMTFTEAEPGRYDAPVIKLLRLLFGLDDPYALKKVKDISRAQAPASQLVSLMLASHIRA